MSINTEDSATLPITSPIPFIDEVEENEENTKIANKAISSEKVIKETVSPIELIIKGEKSTVINIRNIRSQSRMQISIIEEDDDQDQDDHRVTKEQHGKMITGEISETDLSFEEVQSSKVVVHRRWEDTVKGIKQTKQFIKDHGEERYPSMVLLSQDDDNTEESKQNDEIVMQKKCLEYERENLKVEREKLDKEKVLLMEQNILRENETSLTNLLEKEKLWISMERQLIAEERKIIQDEHRIFQRERDMIELEKKLAKQLAKKGNKGDMKLVPFNDCPDVPIYIPVYKLPNKSTKTVHTQTDNKCKKGCKKKIQQSSRELPSLGIFPEVFPRVVVTRMNFPNASFGPVISEIDDKEDAVRLCESKSAPIKLDNVETKNAEGTIESFHVGYPDDFYSNEADKATRPLTSIGKDIYKKLSDYSVKDDDRLKDGIKPESKVSSVKLVFNPTCPIRISIPDDNFVNDNELASSRDEKNNRKPTPVLKSRLWDSESVKLKRTITKDIPENHHYHSENHQNGLLSITIESGTTINLSFGGDGFSSSPLSCPCCCCPKTKSVKVDTEDLGLAGGQFLSKNESKENLSPRTAGLLKALENKLKSVGKDGENVYIIKHLKEDKSVRTYYCQDCLATMRVLDDRGNVQKIVNKFESLNKPSFC